MKTNRLLVASLLCLTAVPFTAQSGEPDAYYLVDTSNFHQLRPYERALLNRSLPAIHAAKSDTEKVRRIYEMYQEMGNNDVWVQYMDCIRPIVASLSSLDGCGTFVSAYTAMFCNDLGYYYKLRGDIVKALEQYGQSLKLAEASGNTDNIALTMNNIGTIYMDQGEYENALKFFNMALPYCEKSDRPITLAKILNNMGVIYRNQGDTKHALECWLISLQIRREAGDRRAVAPLLNNIAYMHKAQGDTANAFSYFRRSLDAYRQVDDLRGISFELKNIGMYCLELGQWDKALEYGTASYEVAMKLQLPENIQRAARLLYDVHKFRGDHQKALRFFEEYIQMRDSLVNDENRKASIRQQMTYEYEKAQLVKEQKEKERLRLENEAIGRRNNLQYSVVLIALLILGGGLVAVGRLSVPVRIAEGLIFFSFLIFFEFLLVLADPYIEGWSGGAPGIKLLFNATVAAFIFPLHAFFEGKMKKRLVRHD